MLTKADDDDPACVLAVAAAVGVFAAVAAAAAAGRANVWRPTLRRRTTGLLLEIV